jgi:hypothetical protein
MFFLTFVYVKWLKSSLMETETFQFYNVAEVLGPATDSTAWFCSSELALSRRDVSSQADQIPRMHQLEVLFFGIMQ